MRIEPMRDPSSHRKESSYGSGLRIRRRRSKTRKAAALVIPGLLLCGAALADHVEKHFKVDAHPVITLHNPNGTVNGKGVEQVRSDGSGHAGERSSGSG